MMSLNTRKNQVADNPPNYLLLGTVLALIFYGVIAIASASTSISWQAHGNTYYYFVHQILFGVLPGLFIMLLTSRFDYHRWQKLSPFILAIVVIMLIAVFLPGLGVSAKGASRWINLGFTTVQPSEFAKLGLIIYLAALFDRKKSKIHDFKNGLLPSMIILLFVLFLIFLQPDLGTIISICAAAVFMFYMAGTRFKHLLTTLGAGIVALFVIIKIEPYRAARLFTFLNPAHDPQGTGYHIKQALLAVGSGGLFGHGYNQGLQKKTFLPEPMGDSIFAVIAEEMGYIRSSILILGFTFLALLGFRVAQKAPDHFGKLLAVGITAWITFQAFINIGAMLAILPLTGIPLPFISYGSSSLIALMAGVGILLNISRKSAI